MNRLRQPLMASAHVTRRRSTPLVAVLIVFVLAALAGPAAAQWGGFGYRRGGYASTASQGAAYGMSEMMRAQGYENLQNSEAAKNWEDVKTLDIQNKMRWTETYFEMRKTNREARAAEAGPAITHDQAIRMAKMGAPPRLVSTQLDPITGHIEYPMVLQDDSSRHIAKSSTSCLPSGPLPAAASASTSLRKFKAPWRTSPRR